MCKICKISVVSIFFNVNIARLQLRMIFLQVLSESISTFGLCGAHRAQVRSPSMDIPHVAGKIVFADHFVANCAHQTLLRRNTHSLHEIPKICNKKKRKKNAFAVRLSWGKQKKIESCWRTITGD